MRKKANAYGAIKVIVLIAFMFIGYWLMIPVFDKVYDYFTDDSEFNVRYTTEAACEHKGYWNGTNCNQLNDEVTELLERQRKIWLAVPFIVVFSLIIWFWTVGAKDDYERHGGL
jgi:hypothetical protein